MNWYWPKWYSDRIESCVSCEVGGKAVRAAATRAGRQQAGGRVGQSVGRASETHAVVLLEPDHVLVLVLLQLAGDLGVGNDVEDLLGRVRQLRVLLLDLSLAGLEVCEG